MPRFSECLMPILAVLALGGVGCSGGESDVDHYNREVLAEQKARAEQEASRKAALRSMAAENFSRGQDLMTKKQYRAAEEAFTWVIEGNPDYPGAKEAMENARRKREEQEAENQRKEQELLAEAKAEQLLAERRSMEERLRSNFLDAGLDIKVKVSGKNADQLRLTYVLFSDVWSHRLQKDGTINDLCGKGFKRIHLSDGYDWGVYWTCR